MRSEQFHILFRKTALMVQVVGLVCINFSITEKINIPERMLNHCLCILNFVFIFETT